MQKSIQKVISLLLTAVLLISYVPAYGFADVVSEDSNEFFEEYKHLGRLCSDMYSCRDGIRQYLEDMECQFSEGEKAIPHWAQDYRKLRELRRTRNTLAHNVSEYQVCTEQDVENVIDFVGRIMQQQDPLAMLHLHNSRDED